MKLRVGEVEELAAKYGVPLPEQGLASSGKEARNLAREIGFPLAMKLESPDVAHRTEKGLVRLGIDGEGEAVETYESLVEKAGERGLSVEGILVQEMASDGREVIVGGLSDEVFGPVVMFGLGGVFVEVLEDAAFRIAPIELEEAREMLEEIKGSPLLEGFRGGPRADVERLAEIVASVSRMLNENRDIVELDINPLVVYEDGAVAVDFKVEAEG